MEELYPQFLDCGYSPLLFEKLSPAQILDMLESHHRQQELKQRQYTDRMKNFINIMDAFSFKLLENIGNMFGGTEYKKLIDVFPLLFQEEKAQQDKEISVEMKVYKEQRKHHAYMVNRRRQKED